MAKIHKSYIYERYQNSNDGNNVRNYSRYVAKLVNTGEAEDIRRWLFFVRNEQGTVNDLSNSEIKGHRRRNIVTVCNKFEIDKELPVKIQGQDKANETTGEVTTKHHYHNLISCGAVWLCSICSYRILKVREADTKKVFDYLVSTEGAELNMITLTVKHKAEESQKIILDRLLNNWRKLLQSPEGKKFKLFFPYWVRATESRQGINGMHPHIHLVFSADSGYLSDSDNEVLNKLKTKWLQLTQGSEKHAFLITGFSQTDYIFQSVKEVTKAYENASSEVAGTLKLGNSIDSMHLAVVDKKLYKEYAIAIKGTKRLQYSECFKAMFKELEMQEKTDSEILQDNQNSYDKLIFSRGAWGSFRNDFDSKAQLIGFLNKADNEAVNKLMQDKECIIDNGIITKIN